MPKKPSEQIEQVLARIAETEAQVHAYVHVDEQQARATADALDTLSPKTPLHGLPFAVKEVFEVAGIPTSGGSAVLNDNIPNEDASVVKRLRDAGAVLVGTQVSHELTCGLDEPPTRNPWNLECYPGGSSAGAGVSVALGSASFTLGTDAAGSVRIPAAMTGTVGFKPSAGLVSKKGVMRYASAPSIDNVGIVAPSVSTVAQVLAVISGPDPDDENTLQQLNISKFENLDLDNACEIRGLKFGVLGEKTRSALDKLAVLDPEIEKAFYNACKELERAGAEKVTIELPTLASAPSAIVTFFSTELAAAHRNLIEEKAEDYHSGVLAMLKESLNTPTAQIAEAIRIRSRLRKEVTDAFSNTGVKILLTPTTPRVAMPLSTFDPANELGTLIPYTCGFNLTGNPAISLPCGFTSDGLPIGLQIIGQHYRDSTVLKFAHTYEQNNRREQKPTLP